MPALPEYRQIGSITLISYTPQMDYRIHMPTAKEFSKRIARSSAVYLEGIAALHDTSSADLMTYHALALDSNSKRHYLEEGKDYLALGSSFGIRQDLLGLYHVLTTMGTQTILQTANDYTIPVEHLEKAVQEEMRRRMSGPHLEEEVAFHLRGIPSVKGISAQRVAYKMRSFWDSAFTDAWLPLTEIFSKSFQGDIRHYGSVCPSIVEQCSGNECVVLMEGMYMDMAEAFLKGHFVDRQKSWQESIRTLSSQEHHLISRLETDLFPPLD